LEQCIFQIHHGTGDLIDVQVMRESGRDRIVRLIPPEQCISFLAAFQSMRNTLSSEIQKQQLKGTFKLIQKVALLFEKDEDGQSVQRVQYFSFHAQIVDPADDNIDLLLFEARDNFSSKIESYTKMGSGWTLVDVLNYDLHMLPYNPLKAACIIPRMCLMG